MPYTVISYWLLVYFVNGLEVDKIYNLAILQTVRRWARRRRSRRRKLTSNKTYESSNCVYRLCVYFKQHTRARVDALLFYNCIRRGKCNIYAKARATLGVRRTYARHATKSECVPLAAARAGAGGLRSRRTLAGRDSVPGAHASAAGSSASLFKSMWHSAVCV